MATDYFPPIKRAVAGLANNDATARTALYDRARAALVKQLRAMEPPLSEAQFTKERLMLEDAIRRVEAEFAEAEMPGQPKALREVRDAATEARELGGAAASAARTARSVLDPEAEAQPERIEPRLGPAPAEPPARAARPKAPGPRRDDINAGRMKLVAGAAIAILILLGVAGAFLLRSGDKAADTAQQTAQPAQPARPETAGEAAPAPADGKITDRVGSEAPAEPAQPAADPVPSEPIPLAPADPTPNASGAAEPLAPATAAPAGSEDLAAVAQRAFLFEEDPENQQRGRNFDGNVTWRTESVSTSASAPLETAIRGQIDIPERKIKVQVTIRRNTDPALPASHTVELQFVVPADFPNGGVQNVPGILMKDGQTQRGLPLSGLSVKVTNGFFLVGLNDPPAEAGRNAQLLRERSWIDLPILYENGRRAILSIEKGVPGEKAFADAFTAWAAAQ
ncbi:MAG: hypothetical protein ACK5W0_05095 [Labrys sp. (in: a-proteobacteria)]